MLLHIDASKTVRVSLPVRVRGQCPFAFVQHTEKFWKIFFQTFRAGMLFFSGGATTEEEHSSSKRLEENFPELFSVLYKGKWALTFSPNTSVFLCPATVGSC